MAKLSLRLLTLILFQFALIVAGWAWEGRSVAVLPDAPTTRFNSLSYAPFNPGESPLNGHFPTATEIDSDLGLLAPQVEGIRTYASGQGSVDVPSLAQKHGLKLWAGVWLGTNRVANDQEIAAGIAAAHKYPNTIDRVVVGNEVLLREDLPPAELMTDIDRVRAAVKQPVTYADVQDNWEAFPELAKHVDIVTVHLLPYWEDNPTDIKGAVAHLDDVYRHMHALFPDKKIAIGETGWPSRGRWRNDAAPGIVNEATFVRQFMALSAREGFDYNLIEAFDQNWKSIDEGTVGARWGLWTAERKQKIPLRGPVSDDPAWVAHAVISVLCTLLLLFVGFSGPRLPHRTAIPLSFLAAALGSCVGYAIGETWPDLYTLDLGLAAAVNLPAQALLAALAMLRFRGILQGERQPRPRNGSDATKFARDLVLMRWPQVTAATLFDDLSFLFVWTALVLEILLVFNGRYRDFPITAFVTPVAVVLLRFFSADHPCFDGGREEAALGICLAGLAAYNIYEETLLNHQSLVWNTMALILAASQLLRVATIRRHLPIKADETCEI